ncbi:MAG: gliding motility-associated C-terminal domain-containing protein [Ekhidna sp.]|nr:gliding motility-associated C-terminal domain-containing protein [Ekhidna sp.]
MEYSWSVEDGSSNVIGSSTDQSFDFNFTNAGTYEVTLVTSYATSEVYAGSNANDRCEASNNITVTVSDPPALSFNQSDLTAKCQTESINIGLSSPDANTISSYTWLIRDASDNALIATINDVNALELNGNDAPVPAGIDTVWAVLSVSTTIGCEVRDSVRIRNFESTLDISSDDFTTVIEFDSVLLEEETAINLSAANAASDISWQPAENFSDPTSPITTYFPQNPTTLVTLTAVDINGCLVSSEITVVLDNIRPKRTFSPNGDGRNDCWEILNIGDLGIANDCEVFVFDARGRNIYTTKEFSQGNCVWDGNFNSSPVPEGVYYFVLKCSSNEFTKSGSILLAR